MKTNLSVDTLRHVPWHEGREEWREKEKSTHKDRHWVTQRDRKSSMETPFLPVTTLITNTEHHSVSHHMTGVKRVMVDSILRCILCSLFWDLLKATLPMATCFQENWIEHSGSKRRQSLCKDFWGKCFWFQCLWWWQIDLPELYILSILVFSFGKSPQAVG